ncbi:HDOD domain-containing protein [Sulfurimonas sp.]|uniref:HDOD domain-containing protein n=1 Tax=Sulfurimonas sp. TaxID=2022749 RepID=UPI003D0B6E91
MNATDRFNDEVLEIFFDQFVKSTVEFEEALNDLKDHKKYEAATNTLFRIFHNLKANSKYFNFNEMGQLSTKVETVLNSLRDINPPISENVLTWLEKVLDQYRLWEDNITNKENFAPLMPTLLEEISTQDTTTDPIHLLQQQTIYYFNDNVTLSTKIYEALQSYTTEVVHVKTFEEFEKLLEQNRINICILDLQKDYIKAAKIFYKYTTTAALIAFLNSNIDKTTKIKLSLAGIFHTLTRPILLDALQRELITVTESHFTSRRFIINNKKIENFIQTIEPLSDTIKKIQKICNDEESSINDLAKVVKHDPIISGMVLKEAKNPLYQLKNVNNIDLAVSLFGKRYIQAIALKKAVDSFDTKELSLYEMDYTTFSKVSILRLMLMIKWYSKVSISSLEILSSTAVLGNIGQLLLAKEIQRIDKAKEFSSLANKYSITYAEGKILHTTTTHVSSDICSHWKLHKDIVDSLRFSENPQYAPVEIYDLALANHVVFHLIHLDGTIEPTIPKRLEKLLYSKGLSLKDLQKALENVIEASQ